MLMPPQSDQQLFGWDDFVAWLEVRGLDVMDKGSEEYNAFLWECWKEGAKCKGKMNMQYWKDKNRSPMVPLCSIEDHKWIAYERTMTKTIQVKCLQCGSFGTVHKPDHEHLERIQQEPFYWADNFMVEVT